MVLSHVDFIAPNVELCVKYCVDGQYRWFDGIVVRVLDRYVDVDTETHCVKCLMSFDDERYTEVFNEVDYNSDHEDGWCFGGKFVHLVEHVKRLAGGDYTSDEDYLPNTDSESDSDSEEDGSVSFSEDDETSDYSSEEEEELRHSRKRSRSLANNVGAFLFMMSPWIASAVVLFNARHEIMHYMRGV